MGPGIKISGLAAGSYCCYCYCCYCTKNYTLYIEKKFFRLRRAIITTQTFGTRRYTPAYTPLCTLLYTPLYILLCILLNTPLCTPLCTLLCTPLYTLLCTALNTPRCTLLYSILSALHHCTITTTKIITTSLLPPLSAFQSLSPSRDALS